jgi:hypothetical protein
MSERRQMSFVLTSVLMWVLLGETLWSLLNTLEASCRLHESRSGLWAECIAPAALILSALFALMFIVDLIRIALVLWASKPEKE